MKNELQKAFSFLKANAILHQRQAGVKQMREQDDRRRTDGKR